MAQYARQAAGRVRAAVRRALLESEAELEVVVEASHAAILTLNGTPGDEATIVTRQVLAPGRFAASASHLTAEHLLAGEEKVATALLNWKVRHAARQQHLHLGTFGVRGLEEGKH